MRHLISLILIFSSYYSYAKDYVVVSPDKKTEVTVYANPSLKISVKYHDIELFTVDKLSIEIEGKSFSESRGKVKNVRRLSVDRDITPVVREKLKVIKDNFNELSVEFKGGYKLVIRAYDDGIAYRFVTSFKDSVVVTDESLQVIFNNADSVYYQKSPTFNSSYETPYQHGAVKDIEESGYVCLPALVRKASGVNVLITESDLEDFPGLWLKGTGLSEFSSVHPDYPVEFKTDGSPYGQGQVKKVADYIAKTSGSRTFPWRVFAITDDDAGLITNTLVYKLAGENRIDDPSWIEPGIITFDWWGRRNIYGTDFKSGVNTETAKYFIDFAAEFDFEYFLFDDGWSAQDDLFKIAPNLDMDEVMDYAGEKGVKIMLWVIWNTFEKQQERAWEQFSKWGISGIKFDFMNRDDQKMVQFYREIAREASKRKMVVDFHGAYKPAGLRRAYPNVLTREALIEFEYNGWTKHVTPKHDNMLPYIRMVAGPMDYIPFTTNNAQKDKWRPVGNFPMGQGTRAHSMALFVVLESPMQMLPDSPSDYYRERECTEFISDIPVEWDDLKVLHAKIGDYTVIARKNGDNWYIGGVTNWDKRELNISFDFLDDGEYTMEYIEDGINADTRAIDYSRRTMVVTKEDSIKIDFAPGGGWIAKIIKR
jgi:alpha-glucosidase